MIIGNKNFETNQHTYLMGILNVTPDSFSDGGSFVNLDAAKRHVEQMLQEGADLIDVGGESTRPGFTAVSEEEEIARVTPIIRWMHHNYDTPISIDTYKPAVARAALQAGAHMINDISCLQDRCLANIAAEYGAGYCLMHNRPAAVYDDFLTNVKEDLRISLQHLQEAGVERDRIMIDPGVGFAKNYEQNLEIIGKCDQLKELDYPVLLGASRKSVIGLTLNLPAEERLEGTLAITAYAVQYHLDFVRVHDVKENARFIKMMEAIRDH